MRLLRLILLPFGCLLGLLVALVVVAFGLAGLASRLRRRRTAGELDAWPEGAGDAVPQVTEIRSDGTVWERHSLTPEEGRARALRRMTGIGAFRVHPRIQQRLMRRR